MPTLQIDLQEGFLNEPVVIRLDGKEIYNKQDVKTRSQTGFADVYRCTVGEEPARIEVELPRRKISSGIEIRIASDLYLGISLDEEGQFRFKIWQVPFGYV